MWGLVFAASAGILVSSQLGRLDGEVGGGSEAVWWLLASIVSLIAAGLARAGWWYAGILCAVLCLGGWWFTTKVKGFAAGSLLADPVAVADGRSLLQVRGVVQTRPVAVERGGGEGALIGVGRDQRASVFRLRVSELAQQIATRDGITLIWKPAKGDLMVYVEGGVEEGAERAIPGERAEVVGRLSVPRGPTNPGGGDRRLFEWDRGRCGNVSISSWALVTTGAGAGETRGLWDRAVSMKLRALETLRARARMVIVNAAGGDEQTRAMLLGLLLGDVDRANATIYAAYARQGLVHILSISGFHLGVMAGLALMVMRLSGDRGWLEPVVVAVLVLIYASMVPAQSPVLRSVAMVLTLLVAEAWGRRYDHLTLLGWITMGLLLWRPTELWSLGFQLSVGLTAALFWLAKGCVGAIFPARLRGTVRVRDRGMKDRVVDALKAGVAVNILCWCASLPVLISRTGIVSPLAMLLSLILTPVFTVLLWCGYVVLLVGMIVPSAAGWASGVLGGLTKLASTIVMGVDGFAWSSFRLPPTPGWWGAVATAAVVASMWWGWRWRGVGGRGITRGRAWGWAGVLGACLLVLPPLWAWRGGPGLTVILRVDTLDVGDGTCHFVRSAGGEALLWDCGSLQAGRGGATILAAADALGIHKTPTAVITHPDIDHFGAILDISKPLGIKRVLVPRRFLEEAQLRPEGDAARAIKGLASRGVDVQAVSEGDTWDVGELRWTVLSPPPNADWGRDNDHSIVARVDVAGNNISNNSGAIAAAGGPAVALFTGDVEDAAVSRLRERLPGLAATLMEIPHHGSARQEAIWWVGEVGPRIAVQSTGRSRVNDKRWARERAGVGLWLTTAIDGATWVEVMRTGEVRGGGFLTGTREMKAIAD